MDLDIGNIGGLVDAYMTPTTSGSSEKEAIRPKICERKWFLYEDELTDEDEMKFKADFYFYKKEFKEALALYLKLLTCPRYGSSRSLLAEIYESLAFCYKRLGITENALQFSAKSEEIGKSADHRTTNLFIRTRILLATGQQGELIGEMYRLLLLHPYNHLLWLELSLLHTDSHLSAVYLLRTSLLLDINSRNVDSFIADKHSDMCLQVEQALDVLSTELGHDTISKLKKLVKEQDMSERLNEEWQNEEFRIGILNNSSQDVADIFHKKWKISAVG